MNRRPIQITIPPSQTEIVLRSALMASYLTTVDQLDCSVSLHRKHTSKSVEEVLQLGLSNDNTLTNFIFKDMSFLPQEYPENHSYWDVGITTMRPDITYFLWIRLLIEDGWAIVQEYGLQESPI